MKMVFDEMSKRGRDNKIQNKNAFEFYYPNIILLLILAGSKKLLF